MNKEKQLQHNDAILKKLDFQQLLADVHHEPDPQKRSHALVYAFCHMLYQQRTGGRSFSRQWILNHIGSPQQEWTEDNGDQRLWYNLAFPCPPSISQQVADVTLRNNRLAGFSRSEVIQTDACD